MGRESLIYCINQFYNTGLLDNKQFVVNVFGRQYTVIGMSDKGYTSLVVEYKGELGRIYHSLLGQFSTFFIEALYSSIQNCSIDRNLF